MRKFLSLALFLFAFISPAKAGCVIGGDILCPTVVASYTGPGDVVSGAAAWWGFRCYNSAYTGNVADVYAPADATHTLITCSSGGVINQTLQALSITCAVSCTVKTLYDQSGALRCSSAPCDAAQATEALRPIFITSCSGSKPCMQCTASSSQRLISATQTSSAITNTFTAMFGGQRNAAFTTLATMMGAAGGNFQLGYNNATNQAFIFNGSAVVPGAASDSAYHSIAGLYTGAASAAVYVDGSSVATGSAGGSSVSGAFGVCNESTSGNLATGFFLEGGLWSGDKSASLSTLSTNQHSYWGF